jgi:hypothetical protein
MPNGTLKLYNKLTNALLVSLDILGTFNIEDNLNETPSNMKVKVITSNTYREEFQVNTVAFHEDTNSWWVIKSDESTYITTGEYEHEIQLVEYLEFYAYRHLPNCAFAPNTYDLEDMLNRLFGIAKLSISVIYPDFLDKDKIMPFFSFENFTVANAIKNVARTINAIPKMSVNLTGFVPTLTFINRNGLDTPVRNLLNNQFPIAYEKNMNSSDQFTTRSVSNITNAKSSVSITSPTKLGYKILTPNSGEYNTADVRVFLPTKIESVDLIRVYLPINVWFQETVSQLVFSGYYLDKDFVADKITNATGTGFSASELATAVSNLPEPLEFYKVELNGTINKNYNSSLSDNYRANIFKNKMKIASKFDFDQIDDQDEKDRTAYFVPYSNEIVLPLSLRNGLEMQSTTIATATDHNPFYELFDDPTSTDRIYIRVNYTQDASTPDIVKPNDIFVQVVYKPVSDIKITIDNDNDAQDEKYFNQSGKVIDSVSVSKLITSHTNDSVEGTKIRNARHFALNEILPLGQLVSDNDQLYVISQRSIDGHVKNGNEYYNVIYTLSRNRIARSENIVADSAVISYKTPDDNLVFRTQLYKDYIELSLQDINQDEPYLPMTKALQFGSTLAGTNFDYTILAKNEFGTTPTIVRYVKNSSIFDLHKSKLMNVNWQDNNIVGTRLENITSTTYAQTPILYTDNLGKATNFELLFLNTNELEGAIDDYNTPYDVLTYDPLIPFTDITNVPESFYNDDVVSDNRFSIRIQEATYAKDPFEIPVFEYMIQGNDDYNSLGNIVIGNDLFSTFTGTLRYHYVINNSTRFTAENAIKQYGTAPTSTQRRAEFVRTNAYILSMTLYSAFDPSASPFPILTTNTSDVVNVGIYAFDSVSNTIKFLFAINDYTMSSKHLFSVYINNWKI